MSRIVTYHPRASQDARDLFRYYKAISPELADDFWDEVLAAIEHARTFPERHHFDRLGRRRSNLRRFPVNVLFRVFPAEIRITVIRHNSRDSGYGSRRQ